MTYQMDSGTDRQINEGKNIPDRNFRMDRRKAFPELTEKDGCADRSLTETIMDVGNMAKDGLWMNIEMYWGMDHGQMDYRQILKWIKVGHPDGGRLWMDTEMYEERDIYRQIIVDGYRNG